MKRVVLLGGLITAALLLFGSPSRADTIEPCLEPQTPELPCQPLPAPCAPTAAPCQA
ncbi:MAG: hypothetical protein ACKOYK_08010 [Cyanobium sp.]